MIKLQTTNFPFLFYTICFCIYSTTFCYGQDKKDITIQGVVIDNYKETVPYAAIGIPKKYIGTSSNEDGGFLLKLSKNNLIDSLEVSSIGYKTFKIQVQDYIRKKQDTILIEEDIVSLSEVIILDPESYVKLAQKKLNKNMLSGEHQINMLYRRSSVEDGKTRFLVEHYMKLLDYGPSEPRWSAIEVVQARKSADYRFGFRKQNRHAVNVMAIINPLRQGINRREYNWSKVGDTSYDGEDLVIIEGREKKNMKNFIRLYIGVEDFGVYKMELSRLKSIYLYKKHPTGKLVLSYNSREPDLRIKLDPLQQKALNIKRNFVKAQYRHEAIVLDVITDPKHIWVDDMNKEINDMGDFKMEYNAKFWDTIGLPPNTKFYEKSVKELESIYRVPLEVQFKAVN